MYQNIWQVETGGEGHIQLTALKYPLGIKVRVMNISCQEDGTHSQGNSAQTVQESEIMEQEHNFLREIGM